jgi:flagellin
MTATNVNLQRTITRLSSGFRINQAGDDAAGLAVANTYRNVQAIVNQGIRNANDGLSTLQIKDGAMNNISSLLDRLATLATQSASGASDVDRTQLDAEFQDVLTEIDREANVAGLDASAGFSVFVSNEATAADGKIAGTIDAADVSALGLTGESVDTVANAEAAVTAVADAVTALGTAQGTIGTLENSLQFAINLAQSQLVSNKAAESRIRDANIAEESANLTRYSVLTQSGVAALAQANQQSSAVLGLLR